MALVWKKNEFKIGINMAGAISAGAYTAGVLDFLMEALEEWQKAKDAFRCHGRWGRNRSGRWGK